MTAYYSRINVTVSKNPNKVIVQAKDRLREINDQSMTGSEGEGIDCPKGPRTDIPNLFSKSSDTERPIDKTKSNKTSGIIIRKGYRFSIF